MNRTALSRRRLVQAGALLPCMHLSAVVAAVSTEDITRLLQQRVRLEGMGLAVARFDATAMDLAAAGLIRLGGEAIDPARHRFEIGSITKTMVGVLLADAVLRGEVALDQTVESLLPDGLRLRDSADAPIRLVDLATHRSGLPRLPANLDPTAVPNPADPYAHYDSAALLKAVRQYQPTRARDAQWKYSNFGYGLLAWVLARQAQLSVADWLRQRLFNPLGLQGMEVATPSAAAAEATQGHNPLGQPVPGWHFLALAGAGAVRASAAELARYGQAALGGFEHPLLEAFSLALQVHSDLGPAPNARMGLGWMMVPSLNLATHDGGTYGFSSSLWLNLMERRGALALANATVVVNDLARHLLNPRQPLRDVAAEKQAQVAALQQPAVTIAPEALAALAGVYALNPRFKLTVRARGAELLAQATGQGEFALFAKAPRVFFARVTPLEIEFEGAEGPAPALVLRQGGQVLRFAKE
jgi:D-alanyl-D-alanine-carboxypeptidase/D-alanyl-D-alanine-endopeptidase